MNRLYATANVLVADREPLVRRQVAEVLRAMGLGVFEAGKGEETLEVVSSVEIHAIVLDSRLPAFGGIETIRVIRTFRKVPPFLLLADEMTPELRFAALDWDATSILPKPVDQALLSDIVKAMLLRHRL